MQRAAIRGSTTKQQVAAENVGDNDKAGTSMETMETANKAMGHHVKSQKTKRQKEGKDGDSKGKQGTTRCNERHQALEGFKN